MDKEVLDFVTFCISSLAVHLNLSQREVYKRLKESGIWFALSDGRLDRLYERERSFVIYESISCFKYYCRKFLTSL